MPALINSDEFKEYSSIVSATSDDRIDQLIPMVSDLVKTYCGRTFIDGYNKQTREFIELEQYADSGGTIFVTEDPLLEVVSVEVDGVDHTNYKVYHQKSAVFVDTTAVGPEIVKITYKGGYAKTPPDLKLALLDLMAYYFKNEQVPRKTQGNTVVEFIHDSNMPYHIRRVLDLYRIIM